MRISVKHAGAFALCLGIASILNAQSAPAVTEQEKPADPPAAAQGPLPTPSMTGPLQEQAPAMFDAGPFGRIAVNGNVSGLGMWTGNHILGDDGGHGALSNGQVWIQKADGWFQFYIQAGAYNLPSLGVPFLETDKTVSNLYGAVPVAFVKLAPAKNTSIMVGALPTLIGAEYTFTFENMNLTRGLLWGQENAVTRGIQVNQTMGKFTASLAWTDGFYSNRYSWLSGALTYANGPHALSFVAGGNAGQTAYQNAATPVQNNSSIYNIIYTFNKGAWVVQPYWQYSKVPTNPAIGVSKGASTNGGAILVNHTFKRGFSLPVRFEYITSSGTVDSGSVNLLFGPGSSATSFTVTPTYQRGGFFVRGDLSWVHAIDYTPGYVFGNGGMNPNQPRAMAEFGFIFGNNIER